MTRPLRTTFASRCRTRGGIGIVLVLTGLVAATGPAAAQKVDGGTFHEVDPFTLQDFCGVPGLTVDGTATVDGRFLGRLQGRDSLFYGMDNSRITRVYTRRDTGQTITDIQPRTTSKDLRVTDNGDGTLTVVQLLTGGERIYGDSGRLIASNSGQVRFELLIDDNDTPSDPTDDSEISRELIFGSTGTNDDFCAAVLADWGVTA